MSPTNNIKAILVGIDEYDAGSDWNLNGCSHDVIRVARWLVAQGVNPDNLSLFISPLDENQNTLNQAQEITRREAQPASCDNIRNELIRFQQESANLFFFYWSGHGNVNQEGQRRLYYANATDTDRQNLDFNNLLQALRGEYYQNISEQLFIVDACANYISVTGQIPSETIEGGEINPTVFLPEQFALFAGKSGEAVTNLNREQIGLFTQHLLAELNLSLNPNQLWLPQMEDISARVNRTFVDLRKQGLANQTPSYLWNMSPICESRYFSQMPIAPADNIIREKIRLPRRLDTNELANIRDSFLACPNFRSNDGRNFIIDQLDNEIFGNINRSQNPIMDTITIFNTCRDYTGGLTKLLQSINLLEQNSLKFQALRQTLNNIIPQEIN